MIDNKAELLVPINKRSRSGNFQSKEIFGVTYDVPIVANILSKAGFKTPDAKFMDRFQYRFVQTLEEFVDIPPMFLIDALGLQERIQREINIAQTASTRVYSYDDTLSGNANFVQATTYFDINGEKVGSGLKPFPKKSKDTDSEVPADQAMVTDLGIWSGGTMLPLVEKLRSESIPTLILTGFIKEKARKRFQKLGAYVQTVLPFQDYDDWAESRDLLTLFIKSGFFMADPRAQRTGEAKPFLVNLEDKTTYFTQPSANLDVYYEILGQQNYMELTKRLRSLSVDFWEEMESSNPRTTLWILTTICSRTFGLPLYSPKQLGTVSFAPGMSPTEAIIEASKGS